MSMTCIDTRTARLLALALATAGVLLTARPACAQMPIGLNRLQHIVVIYLENRSFDNLYGLFPGANGIANAGAAAQQVDHDGTPFATLPPVIDTRLRPPAPDTRFPTDLPNGPFRIEPYVPLAGGRTGDLVHRFYQQQEQINGGTMNKFAVVSNAGGLVMGHFDGSTMQLWEYAKRYTLADHFFHAAFGGSFLNHFWLICACSPQHFHAPEHIRAQLDTHGTRVKDGLVTPDGYAVNTMQPEHGPKNPALHHDELLPPQDMPTIGDRLSEQGITWAYYAGGWNEANAGTVEPTQFSYHHQPFAFFKRYGPGTEGRARHLKDLDDFLTDIAQGTLPAVAFYKPRRGINQHPCCTDVAAGDAHVADLLRRIEGSPAWSSTAVIVTYDENGGWWDHVAPPVVDRWGPGARVPAIIVSPFARKGSIDHTVYDTTSILKLIETRFGLAPLGERDAKANGLTNAFDFGR
jgi:phospholipase C